MPTFVYMLRGSKGGHVYVVSESYYNVAIESRLHGELWSVIHRLDYENVRDNLDDLRDKYGEKYESVCSYAARRGGGVSDSSVDSGHTDPKLLHVGKTMKTYPGMRGEIEEDD